MIETILKLIGSGVEFLHTREKRKYQDQYLKLRREYYEEANKPYHEVDDARLSYIKHELKLLGSIVADELKGQAAKDL